MPWKLGYFDAFNKIVATLPVQTEGGALDFDREECLQLYPKVDVVDATGNPSLHINRLRRVDRPSINLSVAGAARVRSCDRKFERGLNSLPYGEKRWRNN
jgi:hypothetical protein